jgi:hypothetical protein
VPTNKKIAYLGVFTSLLFFASCGGYKAKIKIMQAKIDSLEAICTKQGDMSSYMADMDVIYNKLEVIKINQAIIDNNYTPNEEELSGDKKMLIQESINLIQQLMYENHLKMDSLKTKLQNFPTKNPQLEAMINKLSQEITIKGGEISDLTQRLEKINIYSKRCYDVRDSLENVNTGLNNINYKQEQELNTVYYCKGSFKELTANKVLDKGSVAIKEGSKLSTNVNQDYFTKTDKRKLGEISIQSKKATLKTSHPANSYTMVTENKKVIKLVIKDPNKFWSISRYCVLMLE